VHGTLGRAVLGGMSRPVQWLFYANAERF